MFPSRSCVVFPFASKLVLWFPFLLHFAIFAPIRFCFSAPCCVHSLVHFCASFNFLSVLRPFCFPIVCPPCFWLFIPFCLISCFRLTSAFRFMILFWILFCPPYCFRSCAPFCLVIRFLALKVHVPFCFPFLFPFCFPPILCSVFFCFPFVFCLACFVIRIGNSFIF